MSENQAQLNLKSARKRALFSILLNILLALGKGVAGILSGSAALIGDAIHSATDVFASTAVFLGIWVAGREHPSFPYGLYKAETVATLVTSIAVILAGYEIGRQAIVGVDSIVDASIALPVALISFFIALLFGSYQMYSGKQLNSPALIADARDYLADSMSTGVVVLALVGVQFGYNVDRFAAGIVSLFVFYAGGHLLLGALKDLLDSSIDREDELAIIHFVESNPRISRVKRCMSRRAGGRFIIDMDVAMNTPLHKIADLVADRLEETICLEFPRVVLARIRPHYVPRDLIRRVTPMTRPDGKLSRIPTARWFLIESIKEKNSQVEKREFIENRFFDAEKRRGLLIGKWLLSLQPDEVVTEDSTDTAVTLLKEAGVNLLKPDSL